MDANDFVKKIAELVPSEKELLDYGLNSKEINEIQSLFIFKRKDNNGKESCKDLVGFFERFETAQKEVGGITFLDSIVKFQNQLIFAKWGIDLFFQDISTEKIYIRNEMNNILYFVSSNFELFLDIIYWNAFSIRMRKIHPEDLYELRLKSLNELVITNEEETNEGFLKLFLK